MVTGRKTIKIIKKWQTFLNEVASLPELQLIEYVGKGSFGMVFKAVLKNDPTQTFYAVKIIKTPPDRYIPELKTLKEYYSIIQKCCPDCLVTVFLPFFREGYDEEEDEKFLIIVSQYVPQTLEDLKGKLNFKEAVSLILKLIECLKSFSTQGLIYTDLKPKNLGTFESLTSCKILDIGGFKRSKQLEDLAQTIKLSESSSSGVLFTPHYAPPELLYLIDKGKDEIKKFVEQELKEGRTYSYMLAAILGELIGVVERDSETLNWIIKENELKPLLEKALQRDREKRPLLEEFEEELKKILYQRNKLIEIEKYSTNEVTKTLEKPQKQKGGGLKQFFKDILSLFFIQRETLNGVVIKTKETLVLEGKIYIVNADIKIEPGGKLIIKNATLEFSEAAGIIGKDCSFFAENTKFYAQKDKWKNITLVGNANGYIKRCSFEGGTGRTGEEINSIVNFNLSLNETYGGALFVQTNKYFLIEDSHFNACKVNGNGGGIWINGYSQIENCRFFDCKAKNGGGIYAFKNVRMENNLFENCNSYINGGGIYARFNNQIKDCRFGICNSNANGGASYIWQNNQLENCYIEKCKATGNGGAIYGYKNNIIRYSKFYACESNGNGGCIWLGEGNQIEKCEFQNGVSFWGGGIYAYRNNHVKLSKFKNCHAKKNGGAIWVYDNNQIEDSLFERCNANKKGGAIFCMFSNILTFNTFISCKPDNVAGECKEQ